MKGFCYEAKNDKETVREFLMNCVSMNIIRSMPNPLVLRLGHQVFRIELPLFGFLLCKELNKQLVLPMLFCSLKSIFGVNIILIL